MKSIIIRNNADFNKIDDDTNIIEFYECKGLFDISNLKLDSLSFTKMDVDINYIPLNIKGLSLFDSDFDFNGLNKFLELEELEITNRNVDIIDMVKLKKLHTLNLNFDNVLNIDKLCELVNLENISLIGTDLKNFGFLFGLKGLKRVIVERDVYFLNRELFFELSQNGVLICDMMGGVF